MLFYFSINDNIKNTKRTLIHKINETNGKKYHNKLRLQNLVKIIQQSTAFIHEFMKNAKSFVKTFDAELLVSLPKHRNLLLFFPTNLLKVHLCYSTFPIVSLLFLKEKDKNR